MVLFDFDMYNVYSFRCGSKPRLLAMLAMTATYMVIELVVGNITNSMALVADSFHMLSDVIALVIAYVSVTVSPKEWKQNTFGWARAEVSFVAKFCSNFEQLMSHHQYMPSAPSSLI